VSFPAAPLLRRFVERLVSVSLATRGQADIRGLVTAGRCFRQERGRVSKVERGTPSGASRGG
jgi:hypothetical protein